MNDQTILEAVKDEIDRVPLRSGDLEAVLRHGKTRRASYRVGMSSGAVAVLALVVGIFYAASPSFNQVAGQNLDLSHPQDMAQSYLASTSEYQAQILEDLVVTPAEYEAANRAVIACVEESGFIDAHLVDGPGDLKGGVGTTWDGSDDPLEDERLRQEADRITTECMEEYWWQVDQVYHQQAIPSEAERKQLLAGLVSCLEVLGIDNVDISSTEFEFNDAVNLYDVANNSSDAQQCRTEAEMAFFDQ